MYAKVFSQIYDGTLVTKGPWQALVTFQQMLVLADLDGSVDMTAIAISRRTTIPLEIIELGIAELLKPDPESRTPDEGGRRIVPLREGRSWGWRVVNYKHYRALKREEDRREYHRDYWHKRKLKDSTQTQQAQPSQPIAEADTEAEASKATTSVVACPPAADQQPLALVNKPKAVLDCPHGAVLALWAEVLPHLPQHDAAQWRGSRADHLRARWRETAAAKGWKTQEQGLTYFRKLFGYVGQSMFLNGLEYSRERRPFFAELAWLVEPLNWAKVHEGKYHQTEKTA